MNSISQLIDFFVLLKEKRSIGKYKSVCTVWICAVYSTIVNKSVKEIKNEFSISQQTSLATSSQKRFHLHYRCRKHWSIFMCIWKKIIANIKLNVRRIILLVFFTFYTWHRLCVYESTKKNFWKLKTNKMVRIYFNGKLIKA